MPVTLTAVGDLMFHGRIREAGHAAGDLAWSLRPVAEALRRGDVLFGNFETPVSMVRRAEAGCKPERFSPPGIGRALRGAGFDVVNVANNHIYDFGAEGVEATLRDLADGGPAAVGVGRTEAEARRPVVIAASSGERIGFLAYATAHMAVDTSHAYVASFPHIRTVTSDVTALRRSVDTVVVSCHTGAQYNPYPAPETRELARAAIGAGAAVFLGHHPHVPQGWERIGDGVAFYSLGNFVAPPLRAETCRTFFARVVLNGAHVSFHEVVPCSIEDDGRTVVAEGVRARDIGAEIDRLSNEIADGHSDDRHYAVARSRAWSQYAATWLRELRRGGPRVILRKVRHFRPYHATLVSRMILGGPRRRPRS
jgi:poly-gamma-glutamate capsule biosynthesis protein CapA/YwtB (metallophosphatase superfamily)